MAETDAIVPWSGPGGVIIPRRLQTAADIVPYAAGLKTQERHRVIQAFESGLYDMGAEFVWRRAMTRLRSTIASLGMGFVGEMLGRADIDESSNPESHLTDYETIRLAEALGVINGTGAIKLRHAFELLGHFAQGHAEEDIPLIDAVAIIRSCIQFALGEENIDIAVDFSRFRDRLLSETLHADDPQVERLATQPPFFLSTAIRVLLASIKTEKGARLQHALENLVTILPSIWPRVPEGDRWALGEAYAEATSSGNDNVTAELKRALIRVSGFDYVPENLRSHTYRKAAQAVIAAHYSFGNFYSEYQPTKHLASLGTAIPKPAIAECVRAYLLVFLGNAYGYAFNAAPIAQRELTNLRPLNWAYYLRLILPTDQMVLETLVSDKPSERFVELVDVMRLPENFDPPPAIDKLLSGARDKKPTLIRKTAERMLSEYKPMPAVQS